MRKCPECRVDYRGDLRRHKYAEMSAEELSNMRAELRKVFEEN